MRRSRSTTFAVEKQQVLHIMCVYVCRFRYPGCNVHEPYCNLWPARLYSNFPHHLINNTIFEKKTKKSLNIKCVFWFSLPLLSETLIILRRTERHVTKNVNRSSCKMPVILVKFEWNLAFFLQIFEKYSNAKFHENLFSGSWDVSCGRSEDGRKDRHDKASSSFSQFYESAE